MALEKAPNSGDPLNISEKLHCTKGNIRRNNRPEINFWLCSHQRRIFSSSHSDPHLIDSSHQQQSQGHLAFDKAWSIVDLRFGDAKKEPRFHKSWPRICCTWHVCCVGGVRGIWQSFSWKNCRNGSRKICVDNTQTWMWPFAVVSAPLSAAVFAHAVISNSAVGSSKSLIQSKWWNLNIVIPKWPVHLNLPPWP